MKIYHTETQADYDALMIELERLGIQTLEKRLWKENDNQTVVLVRAIGRYIDNRTDTTFGGLARTLKNYPRVPIIKYKEKAEDKMRFTKENVEKAIDEYFQEADFESCGDLIAEIHNLDDKPEKVVVPKFVAEWIELNRSEGVQLSRLLACYREIRDNSSNRLSKTDDAGDWFAKNPYKFVRAYEDGYTIEPEQLYYIPLPDLETTDGIQQVLSKRENGKNYFASRPNENLKQRFTKEELAQVPEVYKFYAKPIEEEEE